jgi:glyoxylase-like metal-dependent hydrolase (beta-lactamase superfamily II)
MCRNRLALSVLLGMLVAGTCAAQGQGAAPPLLTVRSYASKPPGSVNTHWIETPSGIVIIDCQRVTSEARNAVRDIQRSGKPVRAILITHAHPDHFGGLGTFVETFGRQVPIYASQRTIDTMRNDDEGFIRLTEENYGDDFEEHVTLPNRVLADKQEIALADVTIKVNHFGEGEAPAMTVYSVPSAGILFPGDIVGNAVTPFLLEGRSEAWLAQLNRLKREFPNITTVYPGHGAAAGFSLIDDQARYLSFLRDLVRQRLINDAVVMPDERAAIIRDIEARYPKHPGVSAIEDLQRLNVGAVAKELSQSLGLALQ